MPSGAMDADVISIETSRSKMELLDAFITYRYPNEIGPGVYDIHSPRVPTVAEIRDLLVKATERLGCSGQIWAKPGFAGSGRPRSGTHEVRPALINMCGGRTRAAVLVFAEAAE